VCEPDTALVEAGSSMVYLAHTSDPGLGLTWVQGGFDDGAWTPGTYGVGYDLHGDATALIQTEVPAGTLSVFTRAGFDLPDVSEVHRVRIGADYDDGYIAWINGVEVFRSPEMPPGDPAGDTITLTAHESSHGAEPDYDPIENITSQALPALTDGANVLAVGIWNRSPHSSDLLLVPRLSVGGDNCPGDPNPDQQDSDGDGLGDACDPS
jgi:hypothetical protein